MQCDTMLVKKLVGHLGVHEKMDHTLEVKSLSQSLTEVYTTKKRAFHDAIFMTVITQMS